MTEADALRQSARIQFRVIRALILREIITRYGRHNVGFLWMLLEPLMFCLGVVVLWNVSQRGHGLKVEVTPFVITGYCSLLLWRNCSSRGIKSIEPNRSLLHHRNVTVLDILASRMILEVAGVTAALFIAMLTTGLLDLIQWPKDPFLMLIGWLLMAWFSMCLGAILGCLSEFSEMVDRLWHPASYFLLAISGTFFMLDWLPSSARGSLFWVPMIHPIEMMRAGYWGNAVHTYYNEAYIIIVCLSMSLFALAMIQNRKMRSIS